jgi:hypothetical protein
MKSTIGAMMDQLFSLLMCPNEKLKYLNHIFTMVLNRFKENNAPAQELQIEIYVNALPAPISMFVK